jgi:hypothetical protein
VPVCIEYEAELSRNAIWEPPLTSQDEETLLRLLNDVRMEGVWKELFRRKRTASYRQTDTFVHAPIRTPEESRVMSGWTKQELAAMEFFGKAFFFAVSPGRLSSSAELKKVATLCTKGAKDLRETAKLFHAGFGRDEENELVHADDLEKIARYLDGLAKYHLSKIETPEVVRRSRGDGLLRAFVVHLAQLTQSLFGKSFYRTLAITAAVALNREVSDEQVRRILSGG